MVACVSVVDLPALHSGAQFMIAAFLDTAIMNSRMIMPRRGSATALTARLGPIRLRAGFVAQDIIGLSDLDRCQLRPCQ
jgi:hypothetical protein